VCICNGAHAAGVPCIYYRSVGIAFKIVMTGLGPPRLKKRKAPVKGALMGSQTKVTSLHIFRLVHGLPIPFMEVLHAVFHGGLVGAGFVGTAFH